MGVHGPRSKVYVCVTLSIKLPLSAACLPLPSLPVLLSTVHMFDVHHTFLWSTYYPGPVQCRARVSGNLVLTPRYCHTAILHALHASCTPYHTICGCTYCAHVTGTCTGYQVLPNPTTTIVRAAQDWATLVYNALQCLVSPQSFFLQQEIQGSLKQQQIYMYPTQHCVCQQS